MFHRIRGLVYTRNSRGFIVKASLLAELIFGHPSARFLRNELRVAFCKPLLSAMLLCVVFSSTASATRVVDENEVAKAGIRRLEGRHLMLYTDVEIDREVRILPEVFDQAYEQWCDYFDITPPSIPPWQATGCLMKNRETFAKVGLLPDEVPPFRHGYALGRSLWFDDQPTPYYRRHLLLHEGTHAFVNTQLGADSPAWYSEGLAELLGTHHWEDGELTLGYFPASVDEVPMLGRIGLVQKAVDDDRALSLAEVLNFGPNTHVRNEPYAWCWALASLLDNHPRYQRRFRRLHDTRSKRDLNDRLRATLGEEDWALLSEEWVAFTRDLEHGYDFAHTTIDPTAGETLERSQGSTSVTVAANQGWQNSGLRVEAGATYTLRADGRYQIANTTQPWPCEPGGVSIRYYHGKPLGVLLAAVRGENQTDGEEATFVEPLVVGLGCEFTPEVAGTLYFRVNDSNGELSDNRGTLRVEITRE